MGSRRYRISVEGYCDEYFDAETKSKAVYRAYRAFVECGPRLTFREFLDRTYVLAMGVAPDPARARGETQG